MAALRGARVACCVGLILIALSACAGSSVGDGAAWVPDRCARHDQCRSDALCVEGQCERGDRSAALEPSDWNVASLFRDASGFCTGDEHCGPWLCDANACVAPAALSVQLPARAAFAYWDASCSLHADCPDAWLCVDGWCTDPARAAGDVTLLEQEGGRTCLSDSECASGEDCVFPGRCIAAAATAAMTFEDIYDPSFFSSDALTCRSDNDCGPWWCEDGACTTPEEMRDSFPTRDAFEWMDASCSTASDCGPWTCADIWCRPPERLP